MSHRPRHPGPKRPQPSGLRVVFEHCRQAAHFKCLGERSVAYARLLCGCPCHQQQATGSSEPLAGPKPLDEHDPSPSDPAD